MATHEDDDKFRSTGKLTLKIEKFSGFAREKPRAERNSKSELIQGIAWNITAMKTKSDPEYLSIYLNCMPESHPCWPKSVWSCEAFYTISILARKEEEEQQNSTSVGIVDIASADSKGGSRKRARNPAKFSYKIVEERDERCIFRDKVGGWGGPFILFEKLLHPLHGSYDAETDSIIIKAVVKANVPCGVKLNWRKQLHTFEKDRSLELYKSGDFFDWTIKYVDPKNAENSKEFNVHKYVLAMHSDVFRAMFTNKDTTEYKDSCVVISDCSQTAIGHMIHFMYTNKLPVDFKNEDARDLLKIADKYQIAHLAAATEKHMIKNLTVENACLCLALADLHNANSLRIACGKMIRQNLRAVKEQPNNCWSLMRENYPQLLLDVLEELPAEENGNDFPLMDFYDYWD